MPSQLSPANLPPFSSVAFHHLLEQGLEFSMKLRGCIWTQSGSQGFSLLYDSGSGVFVSLALESTNKAWNRKWVQGSAEELSRVQLFGCGLAAGITAKVCCHPLDVVKKRFQVGGLKRHPRYGAIVEETAQRNVLDTAKNILEVEGIAGLYKGLYPSLVKAAPASAITFVVYELLSEWLQSSLT
ncbi:hypothetical protein L7F22_029657 [Adiantum nelumboides]|nr:hypothetical protein [Adiantum nelumboides]